MSKAQQLAERLKRDIPNGDGYSSEFANHLAEVVEYLSQDEQEPVAWLTAFARLIEKAHGIGE